MNNKTLIAGLLTGVFAGTASAATLSATLLSGLTPHPTGFGSVVTGNYQVTVTDTTGLTILGGDISSGSPFKSFCVEIGETLTGSTASYSFGVSDQAILGGASPDEPQPLAFQTAYLYTQYRAIIAGGGSGSIGSESFDQSVASNVNALQDAIWFFQQQFGAGAASTSLSAKAQGFVAAANSAGWTSIGNVRVLNIGGPTTGGDGTQYPNGANQDLLVLIPLPQGVGLATAGLLVLGARRRRGI